MSSATFRHLSSPLDPPSPPSILRQVAWEDYCANFELLGASPCACPDPDTAVLAACDCGRAPDGPRNVVRGNAAAGSERLGFKFLRHGYLERSHALAFVTCGCGFGETGTAVSW